LRAKERRQLRLFFVVSRSCADESCATAAIGEASTASVAADHTAPADGRNPKFYSDLAVRRIAPAAH
jgi:hypothetical protein